MSFNDLRVGEKMHADLGVETRGVAPSLDGKLATHETVGGIRPESDIVEYV